MTAIVIERSQSAREASPAAKRAHYWKSGAGEGIRTLDPNLGKVVLYP